MSKITLTNTQRAVLTAASNTAALTAWPLPKKLGLSAGSAAIVVRGLLQKGLLEKRLALGDDPTWKEHDGKRFALVITKDGLAACGIYAADESAQTGSVAGNKAVVAGVSQDVANVPRAGSKLAALVGLLGREDGATIEEMAQATEWQPHSVRGVLSGTLRKRFGLTVVSEKDGERGRIYKAIAGSGSV